MHKPDMMPERGYKDLYHIGGVASFLVAALVLFAVLAFFIWPYSPMGHSTAEILEKLAEDPLGGLISLDLIMLITVLVNLLPMMALYAALKRVNESYALIALVLCVLAVSTVITSRPLTEMYLLSELYTKAQATAQQNAYLAAAEAFRLLFDGTAWFVQTILLMLSGLILSLLMLRSPVFTKTMAWTGITISVLGLGFFIPKVGIPLLFLNTIGTILWYSIVGPALLRIGKAMPPASEPMA
jgi:hypothetical protein